MNIHNLFLRGAGLVLFCGLAAAQWSHAATLTVTPSAVSNTYNGYITLQIGGVPTGATVVVQKYFDANSNGVVDAGDLLVQQGNPQDGKTSPVIGGVTNFNVPGDTDGASDGSITARILFNNGDFIQKTIGQYLFVVSSTNGAFTPLTNLFTVTNLPYPQKITGTITNDTGTAVPNAVVVVFPPPRGGDHGPGTPVAGGVANGSGVYSIAMPVGSYVPMGFKSNFVANYSASPLVTVGSGQTVTTNLLLSNATSSVSGTYVDATNSSRVQAGVFIPLSANSGLIAAGFTDSNGNFNVPVPPGWSWSVGSDSSALIAHGYVGYDNNPTNVNSGASGVTIGFPRESALFYGTILDTLGSPIPGIAIEAFDHNNNIYQQDGWTDTNGNYVTPAVGGLGLIDQWTVDVDQHPTNYVFAIPAIQQTGGTNIAVSQAVRVDFLGMKATQTITGHVQDNNSNAIVGVGVYAYAFVGTNVFQTDNADTDNNGNYTLYVGNTNEWGVSVLECCGNDSLNDLGSYQAPPDGDVIVSNNNPVVNFTVQQCTGVQISTTNLPSGTVGNFYDVFLQGTTCGIQNWSVTDPQDFPSGLNLANNGEISGTPGAQGTYNFTVKLDDGNGNSTNQSLSLTINPGVSQLQINTSSIPNSTNGVFYTTTLQASGGLGAYTWGLVQGSASLPANINLSAGGVLSGVPATAATNYNFIVQVADTNSDVNYKQLSLTVTGMPPGVSLSMVPAGNGTLKFSFSTVNGVNYSLLSSPDLKTWTTVLTFTGGGGPETISAPTTGSAETFYRIKTGP